MHVFEQTCIGAIWQKTGEDYILWFLCQQPGRSRLQVATYIEGHLRQKSRCSKNFCYRLIIMKTADYSHTRLSLRTNCARGRAKSREPIYEENAFGLPTLQDA